MANPSPHQMVTCPYDEAHQLEHFRMHIHLQKCRKQYTGYGKQVCPFDSTHVVNDVELDYHVSICSQRGMLDSQLYVMDSDYRPAVEVQPVPVVECEENWEDFNTQSYKPDAAKKGAHIIKKIKGATPSERRKARMEGIANYKPLE